jgi:tRNA(Ile)-lysidine synthase
VESVLDLIEDGRPNRLLDLPSGVKIRREYSNLIILGGTESNAKLSERLQITEKNKGRYEDDKWEANDYYYTVEIPGRVDIKEVGMGIALDIIDNKGQFNFKSDDTVFMDYENVSFPVVIRNRKPGDRIQPFGIKGRKKVSSIFIDEKVPMIQRKKIPLLVDQKSVLWILGMKLSNRVKITDATEKILRAKII